MAENSLCSVEGCGSPLKARGMCGPCYNNKRKIEKLARFNKTMTAGLPLLCRICEIVKPLSEYNKGCLKLYDARPICKECERKKGRDGYKANRPKKEHIYSSQKFKDRQYDINIRMRYGINTEDKQYIMERQGGRCALCLRIFEETGTKKPAVDHDHKTGKVRGVLCHRCNFSLGCYEELKNNPQTEWYLNNPPAEYVLLGEHLYDDSE